MMGFWDGSGISWTIGKQSAPHSKQITTPTPHHFTGQMPCHPTNSVKALKVYKRPQKADDIQTYIHTPV